MSIAKSNDSRPVQSINEPVLMPLSADLSIQILPNVEYGYLMTTNEVAKGYDIAPNTLSMHMYRHSNEIKEGVHFVKGITYSEAYNIKPKADRVFWTKAGVIRLGFFITSERAIFFRDWAEKVILEKLSAPAPVPALPPAPRRKHNRLTQERLLKIMALVCQIEDKELRIKIANELTEGGVS